MVPVHSDTGSDSGRAGPEVVGAGVVSDSESESDHVGVYRGMSRIRGRGRGRGRGGVE